MKFRFAIVDDAIFIREIIKNIGEGLGGTCVGEAEDGRDAVTLVKRTLPDILFLDLVMPLRNGIEVMDEITEVWPEIKIIICSTLEPDQVADKIEGKNIQHFLTKPFTKEELKVAVEEILKERKEQSRV